MRLAPLVLLTACPRPVDAPNPRLPDPVLPGAHDSPVTSAGCEAGLEPSSGYCCAPAETWSDHHVLCMVISAVEVSPESARRRGSRRDDPILGSFYWIPDAELWMMEHEVTQEAWMTVMGENPSYFRGCGRECPVEQVSWNDIQVFLDRLEDLVHVRYQLPDEYSWQLAAQAGQDFLFSGSDDLDAVAWYRDNSGGTPHPVCQKQRNAYGLCDMTGNIMECTDSLQNNYRIDRGGHFNFNVYDSRIGYRDGNDSAGRSHLLGFRLVYIEAW